MAKKYDDEYEDDDLPRRPRRRDEDYDDEDDDLPRRRDRRYREEMSWIDKQFLSTSMVVLVFFSICCGNLALIFGILGVAMCKVPEAKQKAMTTLIIAAVVSVGSVVFWIIATMLGGGPAAGPRRF